MTLEFIIPFIVSYLLISVGFYIFQKINYKNFYKNNFSLRNTFLFETHNFNSGSNLILRIWYPLFSIIEVIPFIVFFALKGINYTVHFHLLVASILLLVSILFKILLFFTKTLNIKFFVSEYVIRMLSLLGSILFLIIGIMTTISENYALYQNNQVTFYVFFVMYIVLLIACISCLFNNKFFNWYNFEKDENEQIKKPKTIYFALYQWIFDYSEIIFVILTTIFMYFL